MPLHEIELAVILRTFDDDTYMAEALLYPEVSRYGDDPERLKRAIVKNAVRLLEAESLPRLTARMAPAEVEVFEMSLRLEPKAKRAAWREPIDLRLDALRWRHGEGAYIAFIPALGIEVVSASLSELKAESVLTVETKEASMLERHVRAELMRRNASANFKDLLLIERTRVLKLFRLPCAAEIRTPKQVASATEQEEKKKSTLEETAINLTTQKLLQAYEVESSVAQLAEALTGRAARSVLLVGKAGVGKTAIVHELVRRRGAFGMGSVPFWATSGASLVAGMSGYGMWQERCDALWREAEKTNAVIHFGNLVELMDTGKSEHNRQGLASFFRQRFARGQALAILECTPEQLPLIEREDPALLRVFRQITVDEPSAEASRRIIKSYAERFRHESLVIEHKGRKRRRLMQRASAPLIITDEGLDALDRLHRRYAGYSAYPGRPLRFLRGLIQDRATTLTEVPPLGASEVTAAFAKETGLPLFLLDDAVSFDAAHTLEWFAERVIGQHAAVRLVVELLATVKAGLSRPRRPVASLLFAGPTGVGKTETAKSLARFFFGDEGRMARFDMSEYSDSMATARLVGGAGQGEGTLTARIREQPFSVLLFDEFEKAHHSFFDLLLQTLGEGRLTDGRGRVADFTNSIVVMTSNLGAERFRRARPGFRDDEGAGGAEAVDGVGRAARNHFTRAVQEFLRPEIFNRIDHIVPFLPLERSTVERIATRELSLIEQRDGVRLRGLTLRASTEAVETLARRGYDARYGARPLKRIVERELLLPLAVELNTRPPAKKAAAGTLVADISVEGNSLRVHVSEQTGKSRGTARSLAAMDEQSMAARAAALGELRRRVQTLGRSSAVIELRNNIWRLTEIERRINRAAFRAKLNKMLATSRHALQRPWEATLLARLPEYREVAASLNKLDEEAAAAEDHALLLLYGSKTVGHEADAISVLPRLDADLHNLLRRLLDLRQAHPNRITLAVYSENKRSLFELARGYYAAATSTGVTARLAYYTANLKEAETNAGSQNMKRKQAGAKSSAADKDEDEEKFLEMFGRKVVRVEAEKPSSFLSEAPDATTAIVFGLSGESAFATYEGEHGLHAFVEDKATHNLFVHTTEADYEEYLPPASLERRGAIAPASHGERRRTYHRTEGYVEDRLLEERYEWQSAQGKGPRSLAAALRHLIDEQLKRACLRLIEE